MKVKLERSNACTLGGGLVLTLDVKITLGKIVRQNVKKMDQCYVVSLIEVK